MQLLYIIRGIFFLIGIFVVLSYPGHLIIWLYLYASPNPSWSKSKISKILLGAHTALAGLLFMLILPEFLYMTAHAKQSEAKTNLGAIYYAQKAYFSRTNTYAGGPDAFKLINWEPAGQNRYAYYCQDAMIPNKLFMGIDYTPMPDDSWLVDLKPASSKTSFTCMAVGNIDNDETLDVWSINDTKILRNDQSDV